MTKDLYSIRPLMWKQVNFVMYETTNSPSHIYFIYKDAEHSWSWSWEKNKKWARRKPGGNEKRLRDCKRQAQAHCDKCAKQRAETGGEEMKITAGDPLQFGPEPTSCPECGKKGKFYRLGGLVNMWQCLAGGEHDGCSKCFEYPGKSVDRFYRHFIFTIVTAIIYACERQGPSVEEAGRQAANIIEMANKVAADEPTTPVAKKAGG